MRASGLGAGVKEKTCLASKLGQCRQLLHWHSYKDLRVYLKVHV